MKRLTLVVAIKAKVNVDDNVETADVEHAIEEAVLDELQVGHPDGNAEVKLTSLFEDDSYITSEDEDEDEEEYPIEDEPEDELEDPIEDEDEDEELSV